MLRQRTIIALVLASGGTLNAAGQERDRPVELDRIHAVIADLNKARTRHDGKAFSQLFCRDGTVRIGNQIAASGRAAIEKKVTKPLPWSETTAPRIENEFVRFVSFDVAQVDAVQTQYGPVILKQTVPVRLLMKLEADGWKIISLLESTRGMLCKVEPAVLPASRFRGKACLKAGLPPGMAAPRHH
jgi:uncharacterized protein (TIGR02246 family)